MTRVRIPADVDQPDRILAGLTGRQLAILTGGGLSLLLMHRLLGGWVPAPVLIGVAAPIAVAVGWLALGRRDGISADRLAGFALAQALAPRRLVPGLPQPAPAPGWARTTGPPPARLRLPARAVDAAGVIDLGADGAAVVCSASSLNFGLRAEAEQEALVAAFGRCLNGLTGAVQFLVRAQRADLRAVVASLNEAAGGLPHPALESAALEHAAFLAELAARRDVLRRDLLVVLRDPLPTAQARGPLLRRAEETAAALAATGISLTRLEGPAAAAVLANACDPDQPARPAVLTWGEDPVVTRARR